MRKLLFAFCLFIAFIGCSDDDEKMGNPIQDLKLPSASETYVSGQSVTIQGKGFNSDSRIWLRAAEDQAQGDVLATIESVNENSITFTVPDNIDGKQQIILKQSGLEYVLGTLSFKKVTERIYAIINDGVKGEYGIGEINLEEKTYSLLLNVDETIEIPQAVITSQGYVYYISYNDRENNGDLKCFDINTKVTKTLISQWTQKDGCAIGIIDDQLHCVKYNKTKGFWLVKISEDGQENKVSDFTSNTLIEFGDSDYKFEYDEVNKVILLSGITHDNTNPIDIGALVALNTNTKKTLVVTDTEKEFQCVNVGNEIYLFADKGYTNKTTVISILDPTTLSDKKVITTLNTYFYDPFYVAKHKLFIGYSEENDTDNIKSFDPVTGECKILWEGIDAKLCFVR